MVKASESHLHDAQPFVYSEEDTDYASQDSSYQERPLRQGGSPRTSTPLPRASPGNASSLSIIPETAPPSPDYDHADETQQNVVRRAPPHAHSSTPLNLSRMDEEYNMVHGYPGRARRALSTASTTATVGSVDDLERMEEGLPRGQPHPTQQLPRRAAPAQRAPQAVPPQAVPPQAMPPQAVPPQAVPPQPEQPLPNHDPRRRVILARRDQPEGVHAQPAPVAQAEPLPAPAGPRPAVEKAAADSSKKKADAAKKRAKINLNGPLLDFSSKKMKKVMDPIHYKIKDNCFVTVQEIEIQNKGGDSVAMDMIVFHRTWDPAAYTFNVSVSYAEELSKVFADIAKRYSNTCKQ